MWIFVSCLCFILYRLDNYTIDRSILAEIAQLLADPVRAAWASGEADTKPAIGIAVAKRSK